MFESDIVWIEFIVQVSLMVPGCVVMNKIIGFRKIWRNIPDWFVGSLTYLAWKIINEIMLRYPEMISDNLPVVMTCRLTTVLIVMLCIMPWFYRGSLLKKYFQYFLAEIIGIVAFICRAGCMALLRVSGVYTILQKIPFILLIVRIIINGSHITSCSGYSESR